MGKIHSKQNIWKNISGILLFFIFFSATVSILAAPPGSKYSPGETLDPSCAPGDTNCSVAVGDVFQATSGTQAVGQVAFWTATGKEISRGSTELFWDNTNNFLGVGTNTPDAALDIVSDYNGTYAFRARNNYEDGEISLAEEGDALIKSSWQNDVSIISGGGTPPGVIVSMAQRNAGIIYITSGNGGNVSGAAASGTGGNIVLTTGNGGGGGADGKAGGNAIFTTGGGANGTAYCAGLCNEGETDTAGNGGNAGSFSITAGNGGEGESAGFFAGTGGNGGSLTFTAGNGGGDDLGNNGGNGGNIFIEPGTGGANGNSGNVQIATSNGLVGIGVEPSNNKLEVSFNSASKYSASFFNDGNATNRYGIMVQAGLDDQSLAGPSTLVQFNDGDGTAVGSITFASNTTAYNTSSDERLKENIKDTNVSLNDLLKIKIRDYTWKSDSNKKVAHGVIAQELFEIYPSAITIPVEKDKYWMVDYSKLTPLIIKSIQDLNLKIENVSLAGNVYSSGGISINSVISYLGNTAEKIINGIVRFTEIITEKITTKKLCVEDVCVTRDEFLQLLNQNNITPSDGGEVADDFEEADDSEEIVEEEIVDEEPEAEESDNEDVEIVEEESVDIAPE